MYLYMEERNEFFDFMEKMEQRDLEGFPLDDSDDFEDDMTMGLELFGEKKKNKNFIMLEPYSNFAS